jgi:UDP-sulfoquinovose synthase
MKVLITGIDGYSGWPLALHLLQRGHDVAGLDNFATRKRVKEVGSWSATPIGSFPKRQAAVKTHLGKELRFYKGDLSNYAFVHEVLEKERPDSIVHLAEQRSAPYSMIDVHHAVRTQVDNLTGTLHLLYAIRDVCPTAHLVKMGTMGEYGTPNVDIPEGFFEIEYRGRKDRLPFPRQAGSWYHWSKVFDSGDVMFATKIFRLRATDVMQGVLYGTRTPEMVHDSLLTRFDFDEVWGTALNRFVVEAVLGVPITVYGEGGQKRGFIALEDSMQSLRLAVENPAAEGEYRVFNQFDAWYSVQDLAELTKRIGEELGLHPTIEHPPDPRVEAQQHYYNPVLENLPKLGYKRTRALEEVVREIFHDLMRYRRRLVARKHIVQPVIQWRDFDNRAHLSERAGAAPASSPSTADAAPSGPTSSTHSPA